MTHNRYNTSIISIMMDNSQVNSKLTLATFLEHNPVFTVEELASFLSVHRTGNIHTRRALLAYYKRRGRIISIRRGLYGTIPKGHSYANFQVDQFLLASKLANDVILSHHTALDLLGKSYSLPNKITYTSGAKADPFHFQGLSYHRVSIPPRLSERSAQDFGTTTVNRSGVDVRVSEFERTMVDLLSRPDLSGSWEEIWRSLESIEFFDLDMVYEYLSLIGNTTTFAKVGFYLEQHKDRLMVDEVFLHRLGKHRPKNPHYMERMNRKAGRLLKRWNLLVPEELLNRSWGEVI